MINLDDPQAVKEASRRNRKHRLRQFRRRSEASVTTTDFVISRFDQNQNNFGNAKPPLDYTNDKVKSGVEAAKFQFAASNSNLTTRR